MMIMTMILNSSLYKKICFVNSKVRDFCSLLFYMTEIYMGVFMEKMKEHGQAILEQNNENKKFYLMTIIGEIEGHDVLGSSSKATKYEHIIPQLALIEDDAEIEGVLISPPTQRFVW